MHNLYIFQLDVSSQKKIKDNLIKYYKEELNLKHDEINIELELAMSSRVSDLEDTINIHEIINEN